MAKGFLKKSFAFFRDTVSDLAWRRPIVTRAAGLVLIAAFFTGVPFYVANKPQYLDRYASMQGYYDTWAKSTHANVTCEQCHVNPQFTDVAVFRLNMVREFYAGVFSAKRTPQLFTTPPSEACKKCHYAGRTASPPGDLRIPHLAHTQVLKLPCTRCHKYVTHFKSPEGKHTPRMATCLECHNGKRAKRECTTCHAKKSFPVSHRASDWLIVHPQKTKELDCKKCHGWTQNYCRGCHVNRPRTHTENWRTEHRNRVAQVRSCEACHKHEFCISCHGEVPQMNIEQAPAYVEGPPKE